MRVVLNMAASLDGRVAGANNEPITLSSPPDQERVHRLRAASDAILVGSGTVLHDDPQLTARTDPPPDAAPLRVVMDRRLRTPPTARLAQGGPPSLILTETSAPDRLGDARVQRVDPLTPGSALETLEGQGIDRVLLEGGPTLAGAFLDAGLVDRFTLYIAPRILGQGPALADAWSNVSLELSPRSRGPLGEGVLLAYGDPA